MDINLFRKALASKQKILTESKDSEALSAGAAMLGFVMAASLVKKALDKVESASSFGSAQLELAADALKKADSLVKHTSAYTQAPRDIKGISGLASGITLKNRLESAIEFAEIDRRAGQAAKHKNDFVDELTDVYLHLKHLATGARGA